MGPALLGEWAFVARCTQIGAGSKLISGFNCMEKEGLAGFRCMGSHYLGCTGKKRVVPRELNERILRQRKEKGLKLQSELVFRSWLLWKKGTRSQKGASCRELMPPSVHRAGKLIFYGRVMKGDSTRVRINGGGDRQGGEHPARQYRVVGGTSHRRRGQNSKRPFKGGDWEKNDMFPNRSYEQGRGTEVLGRREPALVRNGACPTKAANARKLAKKRTCYLQLM